MTITINDKPYILPGGSTLNDALILAGIAASGIATAVNGEVIPSPSRSTHKLNEGDRILIIKAFYGG